LIDEKMFFKERILFNLRQQPVLSCPLPQKQRSKKVGTKTFA